MACCKAIGIDLGTTYCCVAVYKGGKAEVVANSQGKRITPSYAWFFGDDIHIGKEAKKNSSKYPQQIVYGIKRLMGRKFGDDDVQSDIKNWPFKVIEANGASVPGKGVPNVQVRHKEEVKNFSPEEISAMFLGKMKKAAEDHLEHAVTEAIITVPAYFNNAQREATITAGHIAGLKVLCIINEPTAAALAYAADSQVETSRTILVFDFGGGTLDVSIINHNNNGKFEVIAVDGDNHLGGEDIDQNLLEHVVQECERKLNIVLNTKERARLKPKCEKAKLSLSTLPIVQISLDGLTDGESYNMTLSCSRFNELNEELFKRALQTVHNVLSAANMEPEDIDRVLLVGGSSRIPKIQQMLQEIFNEDKISRSINPDEAVACGAAVQAYLQTNDQTNENRQLVISDVIPLSLGVDIKGDMMSKIINRNSKIPIMESKKYVTTEDNQTCISFRVLEGERLMSDDNNLLGHFVLHGLPPAPKGHITAIVTFEVDKNGVLTVSAVEEITGSKTKFTITSDRQQISEKEINRMIKEAEEFKLDDERREKRASLTNAIEDYIYKIQKAIEGNLKAKISIPDKRTVSLLCDDTSKWIADNKTADILELIMKKKTLADAWEPILKKIGNK